MSYVLGFEDESCLSREAAGGKGATLADLTRAGFPVPSGFCVTTSAYAEFIHSGALEPQLRELIVALTTDDPVALERQTARIRQLVRETPLPEA
ncbi:MAG: pyruvate, phosphate dikinase, partial [Actinobacteria bacterium]|nr:pyruvate, phosphate dikinase [Actinomycetota bacterium]